MRTSGGPGLLPSALPTAPAVEKQVGVFRVEGPPQLCPNPDSQAGLQGTALESCPVQHCEAELPSPLTVRKPRLSGVTGLPKPPSSQGPVSTSHCMWTCPGLTWRGQQIPGWRGLHMSPRVSCRTLLHCQDFQSCHPPSPGQWP